MTYADAILIRIPEEGVVVVGKLDGSDYVLTCKSYPGFKARIPRDTPVEKRKLRAYEKVAEYYRIRHEKEYGYHPPRSEGHTGGWKMIDLKKHTDIGSHGKRRRVK